jgi:hypothetical protein
MPQRNFSDDPNWRPSALGSTGSVEFEHNGRGFHSINVDFNQQAFNDFIQQVKAKIIDKCLDEGAPLEEAVERIEVAGEYAKDVHTEAVEDGASPTEAATQAQEKAEVLDKVSSKIAKKLKQEEQRPSNSESTSSPISSSKEPTSANLISERFLVAQPSAEQMQEADAYQFLIKKRIEETAADPHNESKLRKLRVTIESYAAEYPRLAKLFGQTLEAFGAVATIGGGYALTLGILAAAGTTVGATPALVSATVFGAATYLVHKAGESLGETINYAATKTAEWTANDPHERTELAADYSLVGLIGLASIGQIKKPATVIGKNILRLDRTKAIEGLSTVEHGILQAEHAFKKNPQFGKEAGVKLHEDAKVSARKMQKRYGDSIGKTEDNLMFEQRCFQGLTPKEMDKIGLEFPKSGYSRYDVLDTAEGVILDYKFFGNDKPNANIFEASRLQKMIRNAPDSVNSIYGIKPIFVDGVHSKQFEAVKVWTREGDLLWQ